MSEYEPNNRDYIGKFKKRGSPMVFTVNGRAELVVQDAIGHQEMVDRPEKAETIAAIRRGLGNAWQRQGRPPHATE